MHLNDEKMLSCPVEITPTFMKESPTYWQLKHVSGLHHTLAMPYAPM